MTLLFLFLALTIGGLLLSDRVAGWLLERSPWLRWWADVEDAKDTRRALARATAPRWQR